MERRKVLFALSLCPNRIGGMEAFCRELAIQLLPQGWDLILCHEGQPQQAVRDFLTEPGNVTMDVLSGQAGMDLRAVRAFRHMLRRYRPTIVIYTLGGVVRWWPLLARMYGVKQTFYLDQSSRTQEALRYKVSLIHRWVMKPLTATVCASEFIKHCCDREGILPPHKNLVIWNSVNLAPACGDGAAFRRRFHIPEDRLVVLKISWLVPDKGIDVALRAASLALARNPALHFVFCGDGEHRDEYHELARELGIDGHVSWAGQVQNLPASGAFQAADLQIQCSQWHEAFCLAVAEGMCAGLPVVASRIGGLPELVEDGGNGFLFEPKSHERLAEAILRLAGDPELRHAMGRAGHKRALARYNVVDNVRRWVELLFE